MRLGIEHVFLEIAHQTALLGGVSLTQHLVVKCQLLLVVELSVVRGIVGQISLDIEQRIDDVLTIAGEDNVKKFREIVEKSRNQLRIQEALNLSQEMDLAPSWIEVDAKKFAGNVKALPERSDLPSDINESLIVELYSK